MDPELDLSSYPPLMTQEQVAEALGETLNTVRTLIKHNQLRHRHKGRNICIPKPAVQEFYTGTDSPRTVAEESA